MIRTSVTILFLSFASCAKYSVEYDKPEKAGNQNEIVRLKSDSTFIYFWSHFDQEKVSIYKGNEIIKTVKLNCYYCTGPGGLEAVANKEDLTILIELPDSVSIKLKKEDLKKYRYLYIDRHAKRKSKIYLEYSNSVRR